MSQQPPTHYTTLCGVGNCERMDTMQKIARMLSIRGMRQTDLARATGIRDSRFTQLGQDNGKLRLPEALRIARALGVTLDYLADPELDEPPETLSVEELGLLRIIRALGHDEALKRLLRPPGVSVIEVPAQAPPAAPGARHEQKGRAG